MEEKNDNIELKIKQITNRVLIGLDIGGTLTKLCIIISNTEKDIENLLSSKKNFKRVEIDSYQLYLYHFQTINYKKDILPILNDINKIVKIEKIDATGGGAFKYCDIMKNDFNIEFIKHDELRSLIYGYEFMNKYNSFYEIDKGISKPISSSSFKC